MYIPVFDEGTTSVDFTRGNAEKALRKLENKKEDTFISDKV